MRGHRAVVEPDHGQVGRHRDAELGRGLQSAQGERVGHRQDRRRRLRAPEQLERRLAGGLRRVRPADADEARIPGLAEAFLVPLEPLGAQIELELAVRIERGGEREHRHALVPELAQVLGRAACSRAVVDPDEGRLRTARLVDRDDREPPGDGRIDARIALRRRVDDEAVDRGLPHRPRRLLAEAGVGEQEQPVRRLLHRAGDPSQERRLRGIGERVAEPLGEDQADRSRPAEAEPARGRIGPRIAQRVGRVEDALPHLVGDELGPSERLRGAAHGDARVLGDISQPDTFLLLTGHKGNTTRE